MSDVIRYIDSAGWAWRVCEVADRAAAHDEAEEFAPLEVQRAIANGRLYFFSRLGTRRLQQYPPAWDHLSRPDLEALCHQAEDLA